MNYQKLHTEIVNTLNIPILSRPLRTVQINIPVKYLKALQSTLLKFGWQHKKPGVPWKRLSRTVRDGGLGFTDMREYQRATQLAKVIGCHAQAHTPQWVYLESSRLE
ncbi:Hypothetical predicted protein, partial [Pelobates cultripes]